jgi:transcriptional regulator with XRE-family HTH domain
VARRSPTPDFADALAREMKAAGLTQAELARRAGVRASAVAYWLRGRRAPGFGALVKVADALGVSLDRLRG